jgi:hypothetical protein
MNVGDLVKRRGQKWYAVVLGFRTDLGTLPCGVELGPLPEGDRSYPVFMWVRLGDTEDVDLYDVQSCSASLLEVVSTPELTCNRGRCLV